MREIKFRAWDNKSQKMGRSFSLMDIAYLGGSTNARELWERRANLELVQYTGLKDKNGVEIYEGDIVRHGKGEYEPFAESTSMVEWFDGNHMYIFRKVHMKRNDEDPQVWDTLELGNAGGGVADMPEVIGNIYENPELLEQNND